MKFSAFLPTERPALRAARWNAAIGLALVCGLSCAQGQKLTVPASQPMPVELLKHVPLRDGQPISARLLYPVYVDNELAIPAGSVFEGNIVSLAPDKHRRLQGKLEGDFTPFRKPTVAFHAITFPGGTRYSIASENAADGAPILHLAAATPHAKKAFIKAQIAMARQNARDQIATITGPGKGDRALQFLYRQLPYHLQRIETGTAWTVNLASPLEVPAQPDPPSVVAQREKPGPVSKLLGPSNATDPNAPDIAEHNGAEMLHAYLGKTISSANARPGDMFTARVAQPVYDADHHIAVPEGAILVGTVTQAKPAKSFGRKGHLRFSFRELQMPEGLQQDVNGMLAGADASRSADLQIDAEGGVQPRQKNRTIVPMALSILASRALDTDGNQAANGTVASNGFGIVGRIAGIAAAPRGVAAGIGFYGAGLAFFNRWIAPGQDVTFVKATRIDVLITPARPRLAESVQPRQPETPAEQ